MTPEKPLPLLCDPAGNRELIARVEKLTPSSTALWGKMTVSQMLRHCLIPLEVVTGDLDMQVSPLLAVLGRLSRPLFLHRHPFRKNLPTSRELVVSDTPDFREVQEALIRKIASFSGRSRDIFIRRHPLFGKMSPEAWELLQSRHLDHHLRQFGV